MKNKIIILASWFTILSALVLVLICLFWLLYPYNPATFRRLPHKLSTNKIHGGNFITIYVDVCKNTKVAPEISRVFVDGVIYQIPTYVTVDDDLGCKVRNVQIYIPKGLPTGKYTISTTFKFYMNPLRTIIMQTKSEQFEVLE